MSTEENKDLIRRLYAQIDNGNLAAMDELVAEDYLNHHLPPCPGLQHGRQAVKQAFQIFWEATPGYHRIEDQIAFGDLVVTRLTAVGKTRRRPARCPAHRQRLDDDRDRYSPHR